jgi:hypothetical protein
MNPTLDRLIRTIGARGYADLVNPQMTAELIPEGESAVSEPSTVPTQTKVQISDVIAVVISDGKHPETLEQVKQSLGGFKELLVHRQQRQLAIAGEHRLADPDDLKVFRRYWLIREIAVDAAQLADLTGDRADPIIYVQDDDCVTDAAAIVAQYKPGLVTCNMPAEFRAGEYGENFPTLARQSALVGFGAVFDSSLLAAFAPYLEIWPHDDLFNVECDRVFTALNLTKFVDVPVERLAVSWDPDRLGCRPDHQARWKQIRRRIDDLP